MFILNTLGYLQDENASESELDLPEETTTKANSMADLLTIFSLHEMMEFKSEKMGTSSVERGRWCLICK